MVSFLFILFVMLIAFGVTTQALLQPNNSPILNNDTYVRDIFYIPFYRLAGEVAQSQGGMGNCLFFFSSKLYQLW